MQKEMGFQERAGKMTEEKWWKSFIRTRLKIVPSRIHEDEKEEITLTDDEKRMCANAGISEEEWIKGKKRVLDEETEAEYKRVMLDFSDVNPNDPESVRRYGERCTLAGETYYGMKRAKKEVKDELITATDTLGKGEELLLVQYTSGEYILVPELASAIEKILCQKRMIKRCRTIPRHITTVEEALKFVKWEIEDKT